MAAQLNAVAGEDRRVKDAANNTAGRDQVNNTTPSPQS